MIGVAGIGHVAARLVAGEFHRASPHRLFLGGINISFESEDTSAAQAGAPPRVRVRVLGLADLDYTPFTLNGHTVAVHSVSVLAQEIWLDPGGPTNNVSGLLRLLYFVSINGQAPVPLEEDCQVLGPFNPVTGQWPEITIDGDFLIATPIPTVSEWA